MREEVKRWMQMAKRDLITAKNSLKAKDYYASCYWSQQSTEKALKAVLINKTGHLIKIHDLVVLGKKVDLPAPLLERCVDLTHVYLDARYGDIGGELPSEKFDEKIASGFLKLVEEVIAWAEKAISPS